MLRIHLAWCLSYFTSVCFILSYVLTMCGKNGHQYQKLSIYQFLSHIAHVAIPELSFVTRGMDSSERLGLSLLKSAPPKLFALKGKEWFAKENWNILTSIRRRISNGGKDAGLEKQQLSVRSSLTYSTNWNPINT